MGKELHYSDLYDKYKKLTLAQIELLLSDMKSEIQPFNSTSSTGFRILNDSSNNLKQSVLIQLLEEKQKTSDS